MRLDFRWDRAEPAALPSLPMKHTPRSRLLRCEGCTRAVLCEAMALMALRLCLAAWWAGAGDPYPTYASLVLRPHRLA